MRFGRPLASSLAALAWALACSGDARPPFAMGVSAGVSGAPPGAAGSLSLGDAAVDPSGPCGDQRLPAIENPPNLNFVIDHSASMGQLFARTGLSKYQNARAALAGVLRAVGHRVNYGVAVFPGLQRVTGCEPGEQIVKISPGDPASFARDGRTGPKLADLLERLQIADVDGGTPVSATLTALTPELTQLAGTTYVVLVTDGAPNCNEEVQCSSASCIPNIEGLSKNGQACSGAVNCCAPSPSAPDANLGCVDDAASVEAVLALADAGIATYVVGMPGSELYADLLDALAVAGGTARDAPFKYYSVEDMAALELSLREIAASVAISCEIALDYEPEDESLVNVYFDEALVAYNEADGWAWTAEGGVSIRGSACEVLSAGDVFEVQILAGCPTKVK